MKLHMCESWLWLNGRGSNSPQDRRLWSLGGYNRQNRVRWMTLSPLASRWSHSCKESYHRITWLSWKLKFGLLWCQKKLDLNWKLLIHHLWHILGKNLLSHRQLKLLHLSSQLSKFRFRPYLVGCKKYLHKSLKSLRDSLRYHTR
jgi:hypothetical protein